MSFTTINHLIKTTLPSSWNRKRTTPELRNFIDARLSRVADIDLELDF